MGWLYEGDFIGGKYGVWGPDVIYNGNYVRSDRSKGAYIVYLYYFFKMLSFLHWLYGI